MKRIACFIFIVFTALVSTAQNKKIDSLKMLLQQEKTDTAKVKKTLQIGGAYRDIKNDSALIYFQDALRLSQKIGFSSGEIRARGGIASFLFFIKADYAAALDLYLQNLEKEEQTGDTVNIFYDTRDIGFIYERVEDFEKELEYINNLKHLISSGIFKDSLKLSNFEVAVDNRFGGLYEKINNLDSSKYYRLRAYNYGVVKNDLQWIALGGSGLGDVYRKLNNRDSSIYYYHIGINAALKGNRKEFYGGCLIGLGTLYWENKQTDSAFYYAQNAFNMAQQQKSPTQTISAAALLAEIYYSKKQTDSAYKYLNQAILLKDSIFSSEKIARIQNLSINESLQKLQQEQTKKEAVQEYKSSLQIYSLIAGLAVLTVIIFILYRNNRQRHTANLIIEKAYTDLKSTQAQLIQSEKMASLGELTAGIAHEIQNPLNFVNNFSELNSELIEELKGETQKAEGVRDTALEQDLLHDIAQNLEKINHHGKRADAIVKGMLQHSSSSSGAKEATGINALADEYLRISYHGLCAKDKSFNTTLKTDFDESIGNINIIPQDIGRVLLNLYNNAFYAVNEKAKLSANSYQPIAKVSTRKLTDKIEIRVEDNGNGIPQKIVDKIFQPFFTTKPTGQGTGLGLSLSYDIIKVHGGEIKVESKEGEGTEFIIHLPVDDK